MSTSSKLLHQRTNVKFINSQTQTNHWKSSANLVSR